MAITLKAQLLLIIQEAAIKGKLLDYCQGFIFDFLLGGQWYPC